MELDKEVQIKPTEQRLEDQPQNRLLFVRIIAANLRLLYKEVCLLVTECCPVLADHLHRDQVVSGGREGAGAAKQRVCVMLPPEPYIWRELKL